MRACESPARTLGDLTADRAGKLIAAASDVALIIDGQGVFRDFAFGTQTCCARPKSARSPMPTRTHSTTFRRSCRPAAKNTWRRSARPTPIESGVQDLVRWLGARETVPLIQAR